MVKTALEAWRASVAQALTEFSNVRIAPIIEENGVYLETFTFDWRGKTYRARQVGRLRDVVIGVNPKADARAAYMALLDHDVHLIEPEGEYFGFIVK